MKRKIGTSIDAALYERTKDAARHQGRSVNEVIEDALVRYLAGRGSRSSLVEQTRGTFRVSERTLQAILGEDVYGVD